MNKITDKLLLKQTAALWEGAGYRDQAEHIRSRGCISLNRGRLKKSKTKKQNEEAGLAKSNFDVAVAGGMNKDEAQRIHIDPVAKNYNLDAHNIAIGGNKAVNKVASEIRKRREERQ
jgi:hypothetical protein